MVEIIMIAEILSEKAAAAEPARNFVTLMWGIESPSLS